MESILNHKNIILGVSGGIAAYKSVELLRCLQKEGASIRVVMTESARSFVGLLTFQVLSGHPVCTDLFTAADDASIRHIEWARQADVVVIAPATANVIGKLANGIADNALTTLLLAVTSPVILCPSMNAHMFESRPVQRNLARLKADGYIVIEPSQGELACGTIGPGRLPEPDVICNRTAKALMDQDLSGRQVLVTAGPTCEAFDPVRFISNPSSGKMGYAIAKAAEQRGADVTLISGPVHLSPPLNVKRIQVQTAREMARSVYDHAEKADLVIKAAAVSDYTPVERSDHKIKKDQNEMILNLSKTEDILKTLGQNKKQQVLVGFAAETQELADHAKQKLTEKNLEMIVANHVGLPDSGFEADSNEVTFFFNDGTSEPLPRMSKDAVAHLLLDRITERFLK